MLCTRAMLRRPGALLVTRHEEGCFRLASEDDKVTRWQGDKVTEELAAPSSVTLSPGHLVTLSRFLLRSLSPLLLVSLSAVVPPSPLGEGRGEGVVCLHPPSYTPLSSTSVPSVPFDLLGRIATEFGIDLMGRPWD